LKYEVTTSIDYVFQRLVRLFNRANHIGPDEKEAHDRPFAKKSAPTSKKQMFWLLSNIIELTESELLGVNSWQRTPPIFASGTKRTSNDVRLESAFGGKAEVGFRGRQVCF
jgi:hypothetical protein